MDEANPRGLLRRISLSSYLSSKPDWEIVLDIDELGRTEGESWVYHGYTSNDSISANKDHILLRLSKGGSDASVVREFDLKKKKFVKQVEENGFFIPESKSRASWISDNELLIGVDLHDEVSLTDSGYPRTVRYWKRGEKMEDTKLIFDGEKTDVSISGYMVRGISYTFFSFFLSLVVFSADSS
jgi:prolyl oligopeptidase